jgi:hypothetical protein
MRVRTGTFSRPDGPSFSCLKSILKFSAGPSGRAKLSIRTDAVRTLLMVVRMLKLQNFFLAFQ